MLTSSRNPVPACARKWLLQENERSELSQTHVRPREPADFSFSGVDPVVDVIVSASVQCRVEPDVERTCVHNLAGEPPTWPTSPIPSLVAAASDYTSRHRRAKLVMGMALVTSSLLEAAQPSSGRSNCLVSVSATNRGDSRSCSRRMKPDSGVRPRNASVTFSDSVRVGSGGSAFARSQTAS